MRRRHRQVAWLNLAAVLLSACGLGVGPPESTPASAEPFAPEGPWRLTAGSIDGEPIPIPADHPITIVIEGSEVGGSAACNQYGGRLSVTNGRLSIADLGMTAMACADADAMAAEAAYTAALGRVGEIGGEAGQLVLRGQGVELRFDPLAPPPTADLVDTIWVLETLIEGEVASSPLGEAATLALRSDGTFHGSTGCRSFDGTWEKFGERIITPTMAMTDEACPAELSDQDSHVVTVVGDGFVPMIEGDQLTLTDPDEVGLVYRSED